MSTLQDSSSSTRRNTLNRIQANKSPPRRIINISPQIGIHTEGNPTQLAVWKGIRQRKRINTLLAYSTTNSKYFFESCLNNNSLLVWRQDKISWSCQCWWYFSLLAIYIPAIKCKLLKVGHFITHTYIHLLASQAHPYFCCNLLRSYFGDYGNIKRKAKSK